MNKEVTELIEEIKGFGNCGFFTMTTEERDLLLDYINQLETNIKDAIELMYDMDWNEWENGAEIRIQQILERGKE